MTRHYVVGWQPSGEWTADRAYGSTSMEVVEAGREASWTGLYDAHGHKLMAVEQRPAAGFLTGLK